jgi:hypothetical protein
LEKVPGDFAIDHIVFAATEQQRDELITVLRDFGFAAVDFHLNFPDDGLPATASAFAAEASWSSYTGPLRMAARPSGSQRGHV